MPKTTHIYRLKVSLRGASPPIWRRIEVPADLTLYRLHELIQAAMGWFDGHMHQFRRGDIYYGESDVEFGFHREKERRVRLCDVLTAPKQRMVYEYDFGDSWEHDVLLEAIVERAKGVRYPYVLQGKRCCPPEDCGGIGGYLHFCEIMANPRHPEHAELLEWYGKPFDPNEFDLEEVNFVLQSRTAGP